MCNSHFTHCMPKCIIYLFHCPELSVLFCISYNLSSWIDTHYKPQHHANIIFEGKMAQKYFQISKLYQISYLIECEIRVNIQIYFDRIWIQHTYVKETKSSDLFNHLCFKLKRKAVGCGNKEDKRIFPKFTFCILKITAEVSAMRSKVIDFSTEGQCHWF